MRIASDRKDLLGPEDGWSLAPVVVWMLTRGRLLTDPIALVNGLMEKLDEAGARIDRLRFASGTIHPQVFAWGAVWSRGTGARILTAGHDVQLTETYRESPIRIVRE